MYVWSIVLFNQLEEIVKPEQVDVKIRRKSYEAKLQLLVKEKEKNHTIRQAQRRAMPPQQVQQEQPHQEQQIEPEQASPLQVTAAAEQQRETQDTILRAMEFNEILSPQLLRAWWQDGKADLAKIEENNSKHKVGWVQKLVLHGTICIFCWKTNHKPS